MRNPNCTLCPRHAGAQTTCLWGIGATQPKVMFVLDMPNQTADFRGQTLDPELYTWLKRICDLAGLKLGADTYITYAVKCGNAGKDRKLVKPKAAETKACQAYLWSEIDKVRPQYVICMGAAAIKTFWGKAAPKLKQIRTRVKQAGIRIRDTEGERVIPFKLSATYSPRILAESPQLVTALAKDIEIIIGKVQHTSVNQRYTTETMPAPVLGKDVGFDIETEGFIPHDPKKSILTAAIATEPGRAHAIGIGHPESTASDTKGKVFHAAIDDPNTRLFGHSIKFDLLWWSTKYGKPVAAKVFDTKVAHSLLDENAPDNSLKYLAATLTDLGHYGDDVDRSKLSSEPLGKVLRYNNQDADASLRVGMALETALRESGMYPLFEFLMEVEKTLVNIEHTGVWIDRPWAKRAGLEVYKNMKDAEEELYRLAGQEFNLDSPDQKAWFLYDHMGLPVAGLTKGGEPSTDKNALVAVKYVQGKSPAQEAATKHFSAFSSWNKIWKGYFAPLPGLLQFDQRVHTTYNLGRGEAAQGDGESGAKTGRLSSSNPNLQNISILPLVRGMFAATNVTEGGPASDWEFVGADYSQLELRVGAYLAQAYAMIKAFAEGKDFHNATLSDETGIPYDEILTIVKDKSHPQHYEIGKTKRVGVKRVNFGVFYGIGHRKLSRQLLAFDVVMHELEVKRLMDQWFEKYWEVRNWIDKVEEQILSTGKSVTPTGRVRHLVGASRHTKIGARLLRQGVNTPFQSFASEITLAAMWLLDKAYRQWEAAAGQPVARLVLQVHDMVGVEFNKRLTTREKVVSHLTKVMEKDVLTFLKDWFNIDFNVPLVADAEASERWH